MRIAPCELAEAAAFIERLHRHHDPPQGHRFSLKAVSATGETIGVVCVGRPVGKGQQDGETVEITRLCTDGTPNACSFLIGAVKRVCRAMGWKRMISYTLEDEPGSSWRAAGMEQTGMTEGGAWSGTYGEPDLFGPKTRKNDHPTGPKRRWEIRL